MNRKVVLACLTAMALAAFVMPASALGVNNPDLTESKGGALLGVGNNVLGTNVGEFKVTSSSGAVLINCNVMTMTGPVVVNKAGEFEVTIKNITTAGTGAERQGDKECTGSFGNITFTWGVEGGLPWCVRSNAGMNNDEFQIRGGACPEAARPIKLNLDSTTIGECDYERVAAFTGTFTTEVTGDAILNLGEVKDMKVAGPVLCPAEIILDMSITLEKDNTMKAEPLYIS